MSIKVHYFAGHGRADAWRMLLSHAKVAFENVSYTFEGMPEAKASGNLEFGQLPVLEVDGKFYSQSQAILRMLGAQHGYYPADAFEAWRVDSTLDSIGDIMNAFYKAAFNPDEEAKKTLLAAFYTETFPKWLGIINKRLESNTDQKHIVGDKLTIADIGLAALAYSSFMNEANPDRSAQLGEVEKFPILHAYFVGLGETFKEHLSTRVTSPW